MGGGVSRQKLKPTEKTGTYHMDSYGLLIYYIPKSDFQK
jgi:hypothetical protein